MFKKKEKMVIENFKLDKSQMRAVKCNRKNVLVLAGAGCGKTYTIVFKVKYLIKNLNIDPKDILCLSFTNEAVDNLKKDLNEDVDVMTFHRLALKIIGRKKMVLSEDMLTDIIVTSFSNEPLLGIFKIGKMDMYVLIRTFINLFKTNNYELEEFYKFINKATEKEKILLKEIMKCYICYESYLNRENLIDFNDIINIAIKNLDKTKLRYKYIIVDEYQDTSLTKFELLKKLAKISGAKLFAVGDDFQSIYRFAGSNVKIITNFRKKLPFAKIIKLKKTYRNSKELIKIAGKFIMKNPYQIRKKLSSSLSVKDPIIVVYYEDLLNSINEIINEYNIKNLLVLARNNKDLSRINLKKINYRKMTVHKAKGLQEEFVFVINLKDGIGGFPNKSTDHEILRFVNNYKEYYKYEEERRLFYVALTRCKKKVYLFVPRDNESVFIKEIKKYKNVIIREK